MRTLALLPALLLAVACSGKVSIGANDSTQSNLKRNPDGSPTGDGQSCTYGGATAKVGDRFPAPDGCNTCTCTAEGAACTEMGCVADAGPPQGCAYNARQVSVGETFPSPDGCNTCSCQADGSVVCTKRACAVDAGPLDCSAKGACGGPAPGMPTILCADGSSAGPACKEDLTAFQPICTWQITACACQGAPGHQSGDSWKDSCNNTCSCDSTGLVSCTAMACACPPDGTIDCMPPVPSNLTDTCGGPYHQWVVANCPKVKFVF